MTIIEKKDGYHYYDTNGKEIHEGDFVIMGNDKYEVALTEDGELGTDATNPLWIKKGRAVPFEFGIYPFNTGDEVTLV